jgi:ATP-dependent helicase/DNAse subunit B
MEVGRLAHLAAEAAVREMVTHGLWGTSGEAGLDAGLEAARTAVAAQERATVLGHPELWSLTRARMLQRLRQLLKFEQERTREQRVAPFGMELAFGLKKAELPAFQIAGAFIGGQVDRVDVGADSVMVLDYKSSKTPYNRKRFAEDDLFDVQLQLPIYVSALATLLPQAAGKRVDAAYVSLRDLDRTPTLVQAMKGAPLSEITRRLEGAVASIVARVSDGQFPVRSRSCLGCHLQPVCRIPRKEES